MPSANLNKELALKGYDPDVKELVRVLGEVYSRKNLGLNSRSISANTTLDTSDAYMRVDTTSGAITVTLPLANNWSSRDVGKTPLIFIHNTGTVNNVTIALSGADTIIGTASVAPGEVKALLADGVSKWVVVSSSLAAAIVGGIFVQKAGDTMTGNLIVNAQIQTTNNIKHPAFADVIAYGADPTGSSNSATQIQAAIDTGKPVYFPPGIYRITSSLTAPGGGSAPLMLYGAGPDQSIIKVDGAIDGITFSGSYGPYDNDTLVIENLSIKANTNTALSAISCVWVFSSSPVPQNGGHAATFRNVEIGSIGATTGFKIGIQLIKCPLFLIDNCHMSMMEPGAGPSYTGTFRSGSIGINIYGDATNGEGSDGVIRATSVLTSEIGIKICDSGSTSFNVYEGVHITDCTILNCKTGIKLGNASSPTTPTFAMFMVTASHVSAQDYCIDIGDFAGWSITGSQLQSVGSVSDWIGIRYTASSTANAINSRIIGNYILNVGASGTLYGIQIVGHASQTESITISDNIFDGGLTNCLHLDTNVAGVIYTLSNTAIDGSTPNGQPEGGTLVEGSNFIERRGQTTPTVTAGSGSFSSVSAVVDWEKQGRYVKIRATVTITTNNTAASYIIVPMPFTATSECIFVGREQSSTGIICSGGMTAGASNMNVFKYDGTYPGASGYRLTLNGEIYV